MTYYSAQSPRGFANEIVVHAFPTRAARDAWVSAHEHDGDVNSATCGAYAITAKGARAILWYRGDAITAAYNTMVTHNPD